MKISVKYLSDPLKLNNPGLREVVTKQSAVEFGNANVIPDDGSGTMEGFFCPNEKKGIVAWGDLNGDLSEWIETDSLEQLFQKYWKGLCDEL